MNDIYIEEKKKNASVRRNIKAYAVNTHTQKKYKECILFLGYHKIHI